MLGFPVLQHSNTPSLQLKRRNSKPDPKPMSEPQERLILFTRYPVPGRTKTRLIPALGAEGAAALQRRLTLRTLRAAESLRRARGTDFQIHFEGATESAMQHWLGDRFSFFTQPEGDLGRRMALAFDSSFRAGRRATVIIGADCPGLTTEVLEKAFACLRDHPVVLGPANDGGYYLIGLRQAVPQLFTELAWGTDKVLDASLKILEQSGLTPFLLDPLADIDRPEDLTIWRRLVEAEENAACDTISVIIPALNEAEHIGATVATAMEGNPCEIIVVDGGSRDRTVHQAREAGATVLSSQPGRARQMNAGGSAATGNALLFLHADTSLPPGYASYISECLRGPRIAAGAFRFAIAQSFPGRRFIEWTTNLRSRWRQMPYGDQGLFMRRSICEELGGFAAMPILEDYDLVRRLRRRGRVVTVESAVQTSGRRWQRLGLVRTTLINKWVVAGYHLGWPLQKLASAYRGAGSGSLTERSAGVLACELAGRPARSPTCSGGETPPDPKGVME